MTAPRRAARAYIDDLLEFCVRIQQYTAAISFEQFTSNSMVQDAVVRNIELLGEASQQLLQILPDAAARFPAIPFKQMYLTRNRLIHGYTSLRLPAVWQVIEEEIPVLRQKIEETLASFPEDLE
jgi:uncharacterized protein with HEPN domain